MESHIRRLSSMLSMSTKPKKEIHQEMGIITLFKLGWRGDTRPEILRKLQNPGIFGNYKTLKCSQSLRKDMRHLIEWRVGSGLTELAVFYSH